MFTKSPGRPRRKKAAEPPKTYRVCKNCPRKFAFTREDHVFCQDSCRKEYHRHGYPNFGQMRDALTKDLMDMLAPIVRRIEALERNQQP